MNSLESLAMAWAWRFWLALLAFSAAVLLVAVLRKPCRRWFGAEGAFLLWLLPPLALVASQLPHAAAMRPALPPLLYVITAAAGAPGVSAHAGGTPGWRTGAMLLWLAGGIAVLAFAACAQLRYRRRLRGAVPVPRVSSRWPVLRAHRADIGPALVGAWRCRIVLPLDFEQRYDATEQALILAHESAHARRGDGWWCLFAQLLAAPFWCHPLTRWALAALRHDQELACDAAVLRERGALRRSYANAMLKTQPTALALPVGCTWSPRHPLTERIAMLKQKPVTSLRRRAGSIAVAMFIGLAAGTTYAATSPAKVLPASPSSAPGRYALDLDVSMDGKPASRHIKRCLGPGEYVDVDGVSAGVPPWKGRFTVRSAAGEEVEVRGDLSGGTLDEKGARPVVRMRPGQRATIVIGGGTGGSGGGEKSIRLDMMLGAGC
jgi:beta-lactamase regulating signal transducer with metallopeptidase domain